MIFFPKSNLEIKAENLQMPDTTQVRSCRVNDIRMLTIYKHCFGIRSSNVPTIKNRGFFCFQSQKTPFWYISITTIDDLIRNVV